MFSPIQLLAWLAGALYIISYQKQSGNGTIYYWLPADFLFLLHYFFLNVPFFMIMALGSTIRCLIALKCSRKILGAYLLFYNIGLLILLYFMVEGAKDYFGMVGTIAFSFSVWWKDHFIAHRLFVFAQEVCWVVAFILVGSYGGFFFVATTMISNISGTGRYLVNQRHRT